MKTAAHSREVDYKVLSQVSGSFDIQNISPYINWQGIIVIRRLALVLCSVLMEDNHIKYMIMTLISSLALTTHSLVKPYNTPLLNSVSTISLYFQIVAGLSSSVLSAASEISAKASWFLVVYIGKLSSFPIPIILSCICCFVFLIKSHKKQEPGME